MIIKIKYTKANVFIYVVRFLSLAVTSLLLQVDMLYAQYSNEQLSITAAVPRLFPPQYQLNKDGDIDGFAIDVFNQVAKKSGINVTYVVCDDWPKTFQALESGDVDLIPNVGISERRKKYFDYTSPVETFAISIFVRTSNAEIVSKKDLTGKSIASVQGNISIDLIENLDNVNLKVFSDVESALIALLSGDVDAMIYPVPWVKRIAIKAGIEDRIKIVGQPLHEVIRAIAVRKGNAELLSRINLTLKDFVYSPEYRSIYRKWYGKPEPHFPTARVLLIATGSVVVILLIVGLWHYRSMLHVNAELKRSIVKQRVADAALKKETRKATRERALLRALINSVPDLIFYKDRKSVYLGCNKAFEEFVLRKEDDLIGITDFDLFPEEMAERLRKNDQEMLASREPRHNEEWAYYPDGRHVLLDTLKTPYYGPDNELLGMIGISRDITERHNSEQALRESEKQLRRSQKMEALGKLTGGIAHDYNNLLGIILGYAEMLELAVNNDAKLKKFVTAIQRSAERGSKLASKLLAFSKQKSTEEQYLDINKILLAEKPIIDKAITPRIKLIYKLDDSLWTVSLDKNDLEDTILNICINAMHAMPDGGQLTIETSNSELGLSDAEQYELAVGDYVQVVFSDTGVGMNEEVMARIFDPFYTTKGDEGSGLGLSQVYGFVSRSGGCIKVYSEPQRGTSFNILFPRYDKAVSYTSTNEDEIAVDYFGEETILVVDDEADMREMAAEILSQNGYNVLLAKDAQQALDVMKKQTIDLVISDVIMPSMDGYQLANKIHELYPKVLIQLASGFSDERHIVSIDKSLHENLLHKPFHINSLLKRVRELLDRR